MLRYRKSVTAAVATLGVAGAAFIALHAKAAPPALEADVPFVILGEDGVMPIYVEDPTDEFGLPIPVGPQHLPSSVRGSVRAVPTQPPAPVREADIMYDAAGNAVPVTLFPRGPAT